MTRPQIPPCQDGERGATLVAVLMIVALMASVAVLVSEATVGATRQAVAAEARDQARWYGRAAETYALDLITRQMADDPQLAGLAATGGQIMAAFPIEGGQIRLTLSDATNCFNLNSLALEGPFPDGIASPAEEFAALMVWLGLPPHEAEALAGAAKDWVDADPSPEPGGAEDSAYAFSRPPYRTPGLNMASPAELGAVLGFSPALLAALDGLVCAPETNARAVLNLNTLQPRQAGLLVAITQAQMSSQQIESFLAARPRSGYQTLDEALASPALSRLDMPETWTRRLGVAPDRFTLDTRIDRAGASARLVSTLEYTEGRWVRTLRETGDLR